LRRTRVADPAAPWSDAPILAQVLFTTPTQGFLSVCLADERAKFRRMISRYPGGVVPLAIDKSAPSRAFSKLVEALDEWGADIQPGERVVDLGASPGSWTWHARQRGARVTAIDRSPLRDDLMVDPQVEFQSGDAFAYEPERQIDWLLSDLIAFPERIIELLERWLTQSACRQFCVTIKFRGGEDYARLAQLKQLLSEKSEDFLLRRLNANKNEVTAIGRAKS
jgi:23S rRNA (cytidine2498-2'-O)-methyltransferase